MKQRLIVFFIIASGIVASCIIPSSQNSSFEEKIDYSNIHVLDSLIQFTPQSTDTIFLGLRIGMSKVEYGKHIKELKNKGKIFSTANSYIVHSAYGYVTIERNVHIFKTNIIINHNDKKQTGNGIYVIDPYFNKNGELTQLAIIASEKWDEYNGHDTPNWLYENITANSEPFNNKYLKEFLIANKTISGDEFIRQKKNILIFETQGTRENLITYKDLQDFYKETYRKIIDNENKKKSIEMENKEIAF